MRPKLLLIDSDAIHAERLGERLRFHRVETEMCRDPQQAMTKLRKDGAEYKLVVMNVSDNSPWIATLRKLQDVSRFLDGHPAPLFLCTSTVRKSLDFVLEVERMGARYVFER